MPLAKVLVCITAYCEAMLFYRFPLSVEGGVIVLICTPNHSWLMFYNIY